MLVWSLLFQWTHAFEGRERVIDYILIDMKLRRNLKDACVYHALDLGSDHRATAVDLRFDASSAIKRRHGTKNKNPIKGWRPKDGEAYRRQVEVQCSEVQQRSDDVLIETLEQRCREIETSIATSAERWQCALEEHAASRRQLSAHAKSLVAERQKLRKTGIRDPADCKYLTSISKLLQEEIRRSMRTG